MKLFKLKSFARDESGAVTVDWVVLTAALVGIAVTLITTVQSGISTAQDQIKDEITNAYTTGKGTGATGGTGGT